MGIHGNSRQRHRRHAALLVGIAVGLASLLPVADPTQAATSNYVVEPGDTLYAIAREHGVTLSSLLGANNMTASSVIHPGQTLAIPAAPPRASGIVHTVVAGDTLGRIARNAGVPLSALLAVNNFQATSLIRPGDRVQIPAGGTAAPSAPAAPSGSRSAPASGPTTSYTIIRGDTLFAIAQRHGVSLATLLAANGLTATSAIHPGQTLEVPAAPVRASGTTYTVVAGDSLGRIAASAGVTLASLLELNQLTSTSLIRPGDQLQIPAGGTGTGTVPEPAGFANGQYSGDYRVNAVLKFAMAQRGKPYVFFTKGPRSFDCSGLTLAAYQQADISLVHHAATQATQGVAVNFWRDPIVAGDLVFLDDDWDGVIDHVGIAINGSTWVHASQTAGQVITSSLPSKSVIISVRRFL